jgi:hypothetical protein
MIALLLRATAIAIAVAAFIDPVFTLDRAQAVPFVLIDMSASGIDAIERVFRQSATAVEVRQLPAHRVPCAPGERCAIVTDGSVAADAPEDVGSLSVIRSRNDTKPNVALRSVMVTTGQHAAGAGVARIEVSGRGVSGQRTDLRVVDGGAVVGSSAIDWKADATHTIDVAWWPLGAGPRLLRVEAVALPAETVRFDNAIDVGVNVIADRLPVLVFDARPSWSSTFLRRALEDDPRFAVEHRVRVAPSIATSTANGRLDAGVLDATAVLIAGAPDALTAGDVDLIDRFVRVRGGTVILLPERVPSGAAAALFHGPWSEQLVAEPVVAGPLRATELLRPRDARAGAVALTPLVIATPAGSGRVIVSGAMDAWRHRDADAAAFDRFWTSVVAEGANVSQRVSIAFDDSVARPASRAPFTVRYRSMTPPTSFEASAISRCAGRAQNVRLWPSGPSGVFRGELPIDAVATCTVEVAVNNARAASGVAIAGAPSRPAHETLVSLERIARRSGGVVTDEDNLEPFRVLNGQTPRRVATRVYPMRSPWWMLPFAGLLSVEWWLRRRNGLH